MKSVLSIVVDVFFLFLPVFAQAGPAVLINPPNPTINVGANVQLTANRVVVTGEGKVVDSGLDKTATWSSSDSTIATVSADGAVTALAAGTAIITAHINQAPFDGSTQVTVKSNDFFVYVPNEVSADISGFSNLPGGSLAALPGFPLGAGVNANPVTVASDPAGKFVYVADIANSLVLGFQVDPSTGRLSPVPGSPFTAGDQPQSEVVDPAGAHLYVGNRSSNNISVFAIGADGALTPITGSPYPAGTFVEAIAMDPAGRFLYATNALDNTLSAFTINADGSLTPISGSPYPTLTSPEAVAVDPLERFVFVSSLGTEAISTFTIDSSSGALILSSQLVGPAAFGIVVDPTGRFAYAADEGASNIPGYTIDPSTGALTALPASPFAGVQFPLSITMDKSGRFVYLPNPVENSVSGFAIDSHTGALTPVPGSPFPVGLEPLSVGVVPRP